VRGSEALPSAEEGQASAAPQRSAGAPGMGGRGDQESRTETGGGAAQGSVAASTTPKVGVQQGEATKVSDELAAGNHGAGSGVTRR